MSWIKVLPAVVLRILSCSASKASGTREVLGSILDFGPRFRAVGGPV